MDRSVLLTCLPWTLLLAALTAIGAGMVRLAGARLRLGRLRRLHAGQAGAVQSLSFVLTLPMFVMLLLLIIQVSQIMIGAIVVHYAAFATARAAIVWVPALVGAAPGLFTWEDENCISSLAWDAESPDQVMPLLDPTDPRYGPTGGGMIYRIAPGSPKFAKIASAAKLACAAVSPSRDLGFSLSGDAVSAGAALQQAYQSMAPASSINLNRLRNKLAYACAQSQMSSWDGSGWVAEGAPTEHTSVELRFFHSNQEPPRDGYADYYPFAPFFRANEVGWQDPIMVKVTHWMALLPGPGRLLFGGKQYVLWGKADPVPRMKQIQTSAGPTCVYRLVAECTLGNEGQKSVCSYAYNLTD